MRVSRPSNLCRIPILVGLTLLLCVAIASPQTVEEYVPGQAVMRINFGELAETIISGTGALVLDSIAGRQIYLLEFPKFIPIDSILARVGKNEGVIQIQPNYRHSFPECQQMSQSFPDQNAPPFEEGAQPESYYKQDALEVVHADSAGLLADGEGVIVAVIDNGLDLDHPLFHQRIADGGYDFIDGDPTPAEDTGAMYGHGTFVSSMVSLLAPGCTILPIRAFNSDGIGTTYSIMEALNLATVSGARIANLSFCYPDYNPILETAFHDAELAGMILVAAAGNDSTSAASYPAAYTSVMGISAIDTNEVLADFSNYGDYVDLCAPGVNVYGALPDDRWGWWSGTSFSAPIVSGICALVLSRDSAAPADVMRVHLEQTARTALEWGGVDPPSLMYGFGCADGYKAVHAFSFGDMDNSGRVNLTDITRLVSFVYMSGGPAEIDPDLGNFNCAGQINLADITDMVGFVYLGGGHFWPCYLE